MFDKGLWVRGLVFRLQLVRPEKMVPCATGTTKTFFFVISSVTAKDFLCAATVSATAADAFFMLPLSALFGMFSTVTEKGIKRQEWSFMQSLLFFSKVINNRISGCCTLVPTHQNPPYVAEPPRRTNDKHALV